LETFIISAIYSLVVEIGFCAISSKHGSPSSDAIPFVDLVSAVIVVAKKFKTQLDNHLADWDLEVSIHHSIS